MSATLRIVRAGPLVTVQDDGRFGRLRYGIAASGPMDRFAFAAANAAAGNDVATPALEVSIGGIEFEVDSSSLTVAITGGAAVVDSPRGGRRTIDAWSVATLRPGERIAVHVGDHGSWAYVAVAGELEAHRWLGSASTHSVAGLGGGFVSAGDRLVVDEPRVEFGREGSFSEEAPSMVNANRHAPGAEPIRVVLGPQRDRFVADAEQRLLSSPFILTQSYDRMGARLDGPPLELDDALGIPSEPIVRGSIQVAGDGVATVLLADHQTTGGYPKIATIISCDLDRFAQRLAGETVTFAAVTPGEAIDLARAHHQRSIQALERIARPDRNFAARLLATNIVGHGTSTLDDHPDDRPGDHPGDHPGEPSADRLPEAEPSSTASPDAEPPLIAPRSPGPPPTEPPRSAP